MKRDKEKANRRRFILKTILQNPEARKVENKYKTIASVLVKMMPLLPEKLTPTQIISLCENIPAIDRELRRQTQGEQEEQKLILSQQWQLNNL
jgi:hypothetical protein